MKGPSAKTTKRCPNVFRKSVCYRAYRHRRGLLSWTTNWYNARTRRGRKVTIANKKNNFSQSRLCLPKLLQKKVKKNASENGSFLVLFLFLRDLITPLLLSQMRRVRLFLWSSQVLPVLKGPRKAHHTPHKSHRESCWNGKNCDWSWKSTSWLKGSDRERTSYSGTSTHLVSKLQLSLIEHLSSRRLPSKTTTSIILFLTLFMRYTVESTVFW